MKEEVVQILKKALAKKDVKLSNEEIEKFIEVPKSFDLGDFAFPCFFLASKLRDSPDQIATELRKEIGNAPLEFEDIQAVGPYLNFFIDRKALARSTLKEIFQRKDNYGKTNLGKNESVVIEYSSPNIAKPFGIGHLRSTIIGNSLSKIYEATGYKPIRINYLGDWGTQFGKLIYGFNEFGSQAKLNKDPIGHLYEIYVKVNSNEKYEEPSREWFKKLEDEDPDAIRLWKTFHELSLSAFQEIYKELGITFDVYQGESMYNKNMNNVLKELVDKKLIKKSDGALIVDLKKYNLGVSIIQKSDGTSLYATRDLAAAIDRQTKYKAKEMIYEVGQEQKLHFQQVFKILELMGYSWAKDCKHVYHGLYLDKSGKKFSTRKGKTVFMKEILDETKEFARVEIKKRLPKLSKKELEKRSLAVAIAAIFYGDLKNTRTNDIIFDIERFVSFEGDTGPYLLYSYARASSIIKKSKIKKVTNTLTSLETKETELVIKLSKFNEAILSAKENLNPAIIANYAYQLSQLFNEFYHECPVIGSKQEQFRISLVEAFRQVIKNALALLGINTIEEM